MAAYPFVVMEMGAAVEETTLLVMAIYVNAAGYSFCIQDDAELFRYLE